MRTKRRASLWGYGFGLAGTILAIPVACIVAVPLAMLGLNLNAQMTTETGEQQSLLLLVMLVGPPVFLPSALLLGVLAGWFHRVTESLLCTVLSGFGSLALVAFALPYFDSSFDTSSAMESGFLIRTNALLLGGGILVQCLAAGSTWAKRMLPVDVYRVVVGAIVGLTSSFCATMALDYILIFAAVVQFVWPLSLTLGTQAGLLNRFTKSNSLTALLSFASVWLGLIGPVLEFAPTVPRLRALGISSELMGSIVVGLLFQWMAVISICAVRLFRSSVWKRYCHG